ncbi:MAG: beta/gamma crystallin-related protein [Rubrivivax sp.]
MPTLPRLFAATLLALALLPAARAQGADVELFDRPDFGGTRLTLGSAAPDLAGFGLSQRASSVIVNRGQWEFCTLPQYRGTCITAGPGRYARLPAGFNDSLASLRPVGGGPVTPGTPPRPEPPRQPTIVLIAADIGGAEMRVTEPVEDLRRRAFNDSAAVVDVLAGQWELCSDGGFGGQCQRFGPGRHELPPGLRNRLSSLRPVAGGPFGPGGPGTPPTGRPWPGAVPALVLYEHRDGGGRALELHEASANLGAYGFNDRASSVEVLRGRWQLCRHADFNGECIVLGPGRHALNGPLNDTVSSVRPVWGRDDRTQPPPLAVTLYEQAELRGRTVTVEGPVGDLRELDFNDRALAVQVHAGRWQLCSSSGYRGRCAEFGPGWYRLPDDLARALSSLRPF